MQEPFFIEEDQLDFALSSILLQQGDDGKLHPMAFHSCNFDISEINYEVHDKELLAIVDSFEQWEHFLEGSPHQIIVFSDHKSSPISKVLTCIKQKTSSMGIISLLILISRLFFVQASNKGKRMHYHDVRV